jgi:hypothetical protein
MELEAEGVEGEHLPIQLAPAPLAHCTGGPNVILRPASFLSGHPRAYLAVEMQIKINYLWAFAMIFADFKEKYRKTRGVKGHLALERIRFQDLGI